MTKIAERNREEMDNKQPSANLARYAGLATQWMVMLLVAVWLGRKVDHITEWKIPVFVILFPLTALVFSLWQLIKEVSKK